TFTIGSGIIESNGKKIQSNPITLKVVKGAAKPQSGTPQQGKGAQGQQEYQAGNNIFLKVTADKSNVYQGEQIIVTYKVYTKVSIVDLNPEKMPTLTGFWSQDINQIKRLDLHKEML